MNGPLIVALIVVLVVVLVKYKEHTKKVLSNIRGTLSVNTDWNKSKVVLNTLLGLAVLTILIWGIYSPTGGSPSLVQVNSWSREHWLWLFALWGIGSALIAINAAALGKATGALLQALAGAIFMLFIVFPMWTWLTDSGGGSVQKQASTSQSFDCNISHHCSPIMLSDGSTEPSSVPSTKKVCFDSSFWRNLSRLGFKTSYQGHPEKEYGCTRDQVVAGECHETDFDTFRFTPEAGISAPKYWFVPLGAIQC